jgi:UDP-N-acetylglucosamine diphosphorylase / glucose-1-phosphate thymidylyltransferase / UDP-N-acetylgalactosamine diphosphorylase / glucosamine-1-phosphate N-acetyltransferase / galactosamine-1-phosphate N-acetyltransferase
MSPEINILDLTRSLQEIFPKIEPTNPWKFIRHIPDLVSEKIGGLGTEFIIRENVAIHKTARVEDHAIIKGPAIIDANTFIASHAYIRGGAYIGPNCVIGPGAEVKSSIVLSDTAIAHFNFVGDSIIGSGVNIEAGAILANYYNERTDKTIFIQIGGVSKPVPLKKFGSIVGDNSRIGANAVLSPGTILGTGSVVSRLALIEQNPI